MSIPGGGTAPYFIPNLYGYIPNLGFNVFAALAYAATFAGHAFWLARHDRLRKVQALMVIFSGWQFIVYVLRCVSHARPFAHGVFIAQSVMNHTGTIWIVLAMLLALASGLATTQIIRRPKAMPTFLMFSQALVTVVLLVGTGIWGRANQFTIEGNNDVQGRYIGRIVSYFGLGFQVLQLIFFQALLTWTMIRLGKHRRAHSAVRPYDQTRDFDHIVFPRVFAFVFFLTVGMVLTTAVYRLAVALTVANVTPSRPSEALYGVFDFAPMWVAATVWSCKPFASYM